MNEITLRAYAKVNLTLDVLYKREDGYHEISTIMQAISLHDVLSVRPAEDIRVYADVPLPENSTIHRAAMAYMELSGRGAHITVQKHIPSEAGLGGASADAATTLRALQALYGAASEAQLYEMGRQIGADVPFCLMGGCALAEGIGERLTPLPPLPLSLVIVKGARGVSTARLFGALRLPVHHPDTSAALQAIRAGDIRALAGQVKNALTPAAAELCPEIPDYKAELMRLGALGAEMSGSGSAVFGIFEDDGAAQKAARAFRGAAFAMAVCAV